MGLRNSTYGIDMDLGQQIAITAMLLLSNKGVAGCFPWSLVVVAAVVPALGIPTAGNSRPPRHRPASGHGPSKQQGSRGAGHRTPC